MRDRCLAARLKLSREYSFTREKISREPPLLS